MDMDFNADRISKHAKNVQTGECSGCKEIKQLVGHWGPNQERKLCLDCDKTAWKKLMIETGRWPA